MATVRQQWAEQVLRLSPPPDARALEGVAVDGNPLRGHKRQGTSDAHLLSACSQRLGVVLGHAGVPDKTNELGAAAGFLLSLALEDWVVTAAALMTQQTRA